MSVQPDRELLELAAKAAGIEQSTLRIEFNQWNPITDDGDSARLEATLGLWVSWLPEGVLVGTRTSKPDIDYFETFGQHNNDKQVARRYAGVRAAAEIGKAMP